MSKAEERALEKYPLMPNDDKEALEALKYIGLECECTSVFNEAQEAKQAYFIEGYHQAEKDIELTWRDLKTLDDISDDVYAECDVEMFDEIEYYQEVLKRFKNFKEKKGE